MHHKHSALKSDVSCSPFCNRRIGTLDSPFRYLTFIPLSPTSMDVYDIRLEVFSSKVTSVGSSNTCYVQKQSGDQPSLLRLIYIRPKRTRALDLGYIHGCKYTRLFISINFLDITIRAIAQAIHRQVQGPGVRFIGLYVNHVQPR